MEFLKSTAKREALYSGLYLVLGIFFVIRPETAFSTIGKVMAILMLIIGVIYICLYSTKKNFEGIQRNGLAVGIILSVLAIYLMLKPDFLVSIVGFVIGFMVIIAGVTQFQNAVDLLHFKNKLWPFMLISSAILIILGIVALVNPFTATETFMFATGIFITVSAVVKLVSLLILYRGSKGLDKIVKKAKKEANADVVTATEKDEKDEKVKTEDSEKKDDDKDKDKDEEIVYSDKI